ncbi:hypothetical protein J3Q64DRAFT_1814143 [Phycomyces blakesleeanus]|uniref:Uncharacterized protein n=2 Tax=Phycomyces blakesleeanus TaxID=4837 RepID=A0A167N9Z9_PHYB8|nr:hypothetical protein PHYBLDRAFT_143691 [Phycomyces blakesleeanus NRRL 1555(-)]OAD75449.1 hypothetical protein PHYBLDRAFT_143691 [Phycomyces blakesleeanus NRRL 1555(-)]|eukprot:XP_018293489.1 hypothetical protein PHYBLDRAFT_143691 [Phycomyces blakesleeanus NRRL 1555(-)]
MSISSYISTHRTKKPYKSWLKDGVNNGPNSMDILIGWLTVKENYVMWRGDSTDRTPKKLLLQDIIVKLNQAGIYHRVPKDVASKMSTLQSNYRIARRWYETEGRSLLQKGVQEAAVHNELLKRFPYWDALHSVFNPSKQEPITTNATTTTTTTTTTWPMSIHYILHSADDGLISSPETDHEEEYVKHPDHSSQPWYQTSFAKNVSNCAPVESTVPAPVPSRQRGVSCVNTQLGRDARRKKRSQEMFDFILEKRIERDRVLLEKEKTRRIRAKADLVKNMATAGFSRDEITFQLQLL